MDGLMLLITEQLMNYDHEQRNEAWFSVYNHKRYNSTLFIRQASEQASKQATADYTLHMLFKVRLHAL